MAEDNTQPKPHRRLKTNVLSIREILPDEMEWFLGGAFGGAARMLRGEIGLGGDAGKTFYGIVKPDSLYPELNMSAEWSEASEANDLQTAFGKLVNQATVSSNEKVRGIARGVKFVQGVAKGDDGVSDLLAEYSGLRYDMVGPATKKNYGKPNMGNIQFDCIYDLKAGQMKFADHSIRTILDMAYPSDGGDKSMGEYTGTVKTVVTPLKGTIGRIGSYNPLPVEVVLGTHYYMAPMVINDVKISSSPDYFAGANGQMLPSFIKVRIEFQPYLLPNPGQPWLVYSGFNMMGPEAGKPYAPKHG